MCCNLIIKVIRILPKAVYYLNKMYLTNFYPRLGKKRTDEIRSEDKRLLELDFCSEEFTRNIYFSVTL